MHLLIGLFLGSALTAGISASATGIKGPQLRGESGPLKYAVIVGEDVICVDPWVSVPERTIECYTEAPDGPGDKVIPSRNVAD